MMHGRPLHLAGIYLLHPGKIMAAHFGFLSFMSRFCLSFTVGYCLLNQLSIW